MTCEVRGRPSSPRLAMVSTRSVSTLHNQDEGWKNLPAPATSRNRFEWTIAVGGATPNAETDAYGMGVFSGGTVLMRNDGAITNVARNGAGLYVSDVQTLLNNGNNYSFGTVRVTLSNTAGATISSWSGSRPTGSARTTWRPRPLRQ